MRSEINFEIKNGAYDPEHIGEKVIEIIWNLFWPNQPIVPSEVRSAILTLDLSHYYLDGGTGAKVTKPIKKILIGALGKKNVEPLMAGFCKQVAELYSPKMDLRAFWGDKHLLGSGKWEANTTCFANDGCNETSRVFLEKFNRAKALVLEHQKDEWNTNYARCIAYFGGGRNIYLANFYYNGLPNNKLLFVEALRRVLGLESIKYGKASFPLPIYYNSDGIRCYDDRSHPYNGKILYPCPHCDVKVPELVTYESGNTHHIGCSHDCADEEEEDTVTCTSCNEEVNVDDSYTSPDGDRMCSLCYEDQVYYCDTCNRDVWEQNYVGEGYCKNCGFECHACGRVYHQNDRYWGEGDDDDNSYCSECYHDKYVECHECNEYTARDDAQQANDANYYCPECYQAKYMDCEKCGLEIIKAEAQDDLCKDCYESKESEREEDGLDENTSVAVNA